jgi:hypothetical protein
VLARTGVGAISGAAGGLGVALVTGEDPGEAMLHGAIGGAVAENVFAVGRRAFGAKETAAALARREAVTVARQETTALARRGPSTFSGVGVAARSSGPEFHSSGAGSSTPSAGEFTVLRDTVKFLKEEGIGPFLRRDLIESGLQQRIGADTPITLARFRKLIPDSIRAGKALKGRLGDLDTRVATVNHSLAFERRGLRPIFEYPVGGSDHFVDLVALDTAGRPVSAIQFGKEVSPGVWNGREIPNQTAIQQGIGIPVVIIKTGEARMPR